MESIFQTRSGTQFWYSLAGSWRFPGSCGVCRNLPEDWHPNLSIHKYSGQDRLRSSDFYIFRIKFLSVSFLQRNYPEICLPLCNSAGSAIFYEYLSLFPVNKSQKISDPENPAHKWLSAVVENLQWSGRPVSGCVPESDRAEGCIILLHMRCLFWSARFF